MVMRRIHRSIWQAATAGAVAGIAGALAMNQFQRLAARAGEGREAGDATVGVPRTGRGPQPAQAIGNASDDATVRAANTALSAVGHELTESTRETNGRRIRTFGIRRNQRRALRGCG
jgi:hypothetical protein